MTIRIIIMVIAYTMVIMAKEMAKAKIKGLYTDFKLGPRNRLYSSDIRFPFFSIPLFATVELMLSRIGPILSSSTVTARLDISATP